MGFEIDVILHLTFAHVRNSCAQHIQVGSSIPDAGTETRVDTRNDRIGIASSSPGVPSCPKYRKPTRPVTSNLSHAQGCQGVVEGRTLLNKASVMLRDAVSRKTIDVYTSKTPRL